MTKECACGLATMELVSDIKRVLDNIRESEIRQYRIIWSCNHSL